MWHDLQATFENRGEKSGVEKFWVYRSYYADLSLICSGTLTEQRFQPKVHSCQLEITANPCLAGFSS
jgi:hypothetical protein